MRFTLAYLAVVFAAGFAHAGDDGIAISDRVQRLSAATVWKAVHEIPLQFDAFHPQGMALVDGDIYVSSVEVIDRAEAVGKGHIFKIAPDGTVAAQCELTDGPRYHPGGIDFDGTRLWVPVAEYRPSSSSVVYTLNPKSQAKEILRLNDHLGGIVCDGSSGMIVGMNWGSRTFYSWTPKPALMEPKPNRAHYVDFQDAQSLPGTSLMLCGGLKNYRGPAGNFSLGGLELIDMRSFEPKHQVPVPLWEPGGRSMLQNAFHAEATETSLRFWFLPGDGKATIYIYEPELAEK